MSLNQHEMTRFVNACALFNQATARWLPEKFIGWQDSQLTERCGENPEPKTGSKAMTEACKIRAYPFEVGQMGRRILFLEIPTSSQTCFTEKHSNDLDALEADYPI